MNVLMISPGFPQEMRFFTRGLAQVGARVIGIGDQPESAVPEPARAALSAYVQIGSFTDEAAVLDRVREIARRVTLDRVECLWEPYMILAARIREMLGLPGLTVEQTVPLRDKEAMKRVLDAAGIRTPHHYSATTVEQVREACERIGFPVVVKPIAGAGSADTYRVDSTDDLDRIVPRLARVPEVSVEEFVVGEDMTYETLCTDGRIAFESVATYEPRALVMKENEWISPSTFVFRDPEAAEFDAGREMGHRVIDALGFQTGYTHMEWYRTPSGEAIFGEIGGRPPGARLVDLINYASDIDTYVGWAETVVHGRFSQPVERKYHSAWVFKRARGQGTIQRYEGLEAILAEFGPWICAVELNPIGSPRRDWRSQLMGDGMVVLRHPDRTTAVAMRDHIQAHLHIVAG